MDIVLDGLKKNTIAEIDQEALEMTAGWTSTNRPFFPDFDGSSFVVGSYFIFSLRIDTKRVPSKVIQKYVALEITKKLSESGREYLSREEKRMIKDNVTNMLHRRVPAVPDIYDLIWDNEGRQVLFFSNQEKCQRDSRNAFSKIFLPDACADVSLYKCLVRCRSFRQSEGCFDGSVSDGFYGVVYVGCFRLL